MAEEVTVVPSLGGRGAHGTPLPGTRGMPGACDPAGFSHPGSPDGRAHSGVLGHGVDAPAKRSCDSFVLTALSHHYGPFYFICRNLETLASPSPASGCCIQCGAGEKRHERARTTIFESSLGTGPADAGRRRA